MRPHPPPPVCTGITACLQGLFSRKRTAPMGTTTYARAAGGRTTGAVYGEQRAVHAFSPSPEILHNIILSRPAQSPLSPFTKTIPFRWEFCIFPPPSGSAMSAAVSFHKNLALLIAKVWSI